MAEVISDELKKLNPADRYSVSRYLVDCANLILTEEPGGNGAQDMASRAIRDLNERGVERKVIISAICIFYRDHAQMLDKLNLTGDGRNYLKGLQDI